MYHIDAIEEKSCGSYGDEQDVDGGKISKFKNDFEIDFEKEMKFYK